MTIPRAFCGLALLLVLGGCGTPNDSPPAQGGRNGVVTGQVLSSPSCPVEIEGQECPPKPVSGATVLASSGNHQVKTRTDEEGRFRLELPKGHYTVEVTNIGGYQSTDSAEVDVDRSPVEITLNVDSGIR